MSDAQRRLKTPVVRASYAHVFVAQAADQPGKEPKFSSAFVFEPGPATDAFEKAAKLAFEAAAEKKFGSKAKSMIASGALVFRGGKGALLRTDVGDKYPGAAFYINARNTRRPGVVGPRLEPLTGDEEFYSGAYCMATVEAYGYDTAGNKGVTWSLGNIQKVRDGERWDNVIPVESEFSAVDLSAIDDLTS